MSITLWHGLGKRKSAVARVWVRPGTGKISINGSESLSYLKRDVLQMIVNQPMELVGATGKFDIKCTCNGGGLTGQADAIKYGIAHALLEIDSDRYRPILKRAGFLTRDARIKERKKYGLRGARRSFQFSKR